MPVANMMQKRQQTQLQKNLKNKKCETIHRATSMEQDAVSGRFYTWSEPKGDAKKACGTSVAT